MGGLPLKIRFDSKIMPYNLFHINCKKPDLNAQKAVDKLCIEHKVRRECIKRALSVDQEWTESGP